MRCQFCKGSGRGCGRQGDCPYCNGQTIKGYLEDKVREAIEQLKRKGARNIEQSGPRELMCEMNGFLYTYTVDPYSQERLLNFEIKVPLGGY